MKKTYNKLVRDKIPEIIEADSKTCRTRILSDDEYTDALKQKLIEECYEYLDSDEKEELADIMEVMLALIKNAGCTLDEIETVRKSKAEKRGKFDERIYLEEVYEEWDDE